MAYLIEMRFGVLGWGPRNESILDWGPDPPQNNNNTRLAALRSPTERGNFYGAGEWVAQCNRQWECEYAIFMCNEPTLPT